MTNDRFMVEVFREVRRVLAAHGTCWVNLGDSYASPIGGNNVGLRTAQFGAGNERGKKVDELDATRKASSVKKNIPGLKPKDLVGIPWRTAFALQADGWWLRSDIIWSKPNPMPESVTDRPTKAHEYVFLLTRGPRYWFDAEAVREPHNDKAGPPSRFGATRHHNDARDVPNGRSSFSYRVPPSEGYNPSGRNVRSVWEIATQPYPEAHFATFPEELARRCIVAGCPEWVCGVCGKPRERIVERESSWPDRRDAGGQRGNVAFNGNVGAGTQRGVHGEGVSHDLGGGATQTLGWSDCGHGDYRPGVVLDPFGGSGTVAAVARKHGRRTVLIELNEQYCQLIARRTQQQSLLA